MLLGLAWYWRLALAAVLVASIPFKVKFIKWWSRRRQGKGPHGKWSEEE